MNTIDLSPADFTDPILKAVNETLPRVPSALFGLLVGVLVVRILIRVAKFMLSITNTQQGFRDVLGSIIEIILWVFLAIRVLDGFGFDNIIVFFSGSIAAIGLAMAAGGSTLISDIIAGLFLARDSDFSVGDEVIVGETPTRGIIESMDARRTRLRDHDGVLHVIPNSVVERKEWVLIKKGGEMTGLIKAVTTAREFSRVALATKAAVADRRANLATKNALTKTKTARIRKNAQ